MRRTVLLTLLAAACAAAPASAEQGSSLVIADPAGDARLLPVVLHEVPDADTRVDAGDLLAVEVSSDGAAALVVRFDLAGDPRSSSGLNYDLVATLGSCRSTFSASPHGGPDDGDPVRWYQDGEGCPGSSEIPEFGVLESSPEWTVTTSADAVELRMPFASLTPEQAAVLRPGAVLAQPRAVVTTYAAVTVAPPAYVRVRASQVDQTEVGRDWTVGEDAPEQGSAG